MLPTVRWACPRLSPDFTRQMEVARDVMRRYRNTFRELAK
jgi:hypothetical protein